MIFSNPVVIQELTHWSNDLVLYLFIREWFSILTPTIGTFSYSAMRATFLKLNLRRHNVEELSAKRK